MTAVAAASTAAAWAGAVRLRLHSLLLLLLLLLFQPMAAPPSAPQDSPICAAAFWPWSGTAIYNAIFKAQGMRVGKQAW